MFLPPGRHLLEVPLEYLPTRACALVQEGNITAGDPDRNHIAFSSSEGPADVLHEQDEVEGIGGTLLELRYEVEVEVSSLVRFGVNQESSAADVFRQLGEASEYILQQASAEAATLMV